MWKGDKNSSGSRDAAHMSVELPVAFIEEGDMVVAYTPALDLSTCGETHEEARRMFDEAVRIFFADLVENHTLHEVLTGLGWTEGTRLSPWQPPKISQEFLGVRVPITAG